MSRNRENQGISKILIWTVRLIVLVVLAGCQNPRSPLVQQLMTELQQQEITFQPGYPLIGTNAAFFAPDLYPIHYVNYMRRSSEDNFIDSLSLHLTSTMTQTQAVSQSIQRYAADEYGLRGVDLAGPLQYYACGDMIAVYQSGWDTGIDPAVEKVLMTHCSAPFVRYPPE